MKVDVSPSRHQDASKYTYKQEERPKQSTKQHRPCQIRIIHDMTLYPRHRIQHRQSLPTQIISTSPSNPSSTTTSKQTYLHPNMPKIDTQLLQQRRLPLITLRPKRRQPARPQPTRPRSHLPRDAWLAGKRTKAIIRSASISILRVCCYLRSAVALKRCALPAHGLIRVGGLVEVEVLLGGLAVGRLLGLVGVGHFVLVVCT